MQLMLGVAWALPLVGSDAGALEVAREQAGGEWSMVAWSAVRAGQAKTLAGQAVHPCVAGSTPLTEALQTLESAVVRGEEVARAETLVEGALCVEGTAADLARLHFLRAVALAEREDPQASAEFTFARALDPDLVWDVDFSSSLRPAFDAVVVPTERVVLDVLPRGLVVGATESGIVPGRHLVRQPDGAYWIDLAFSDTLVVPRAFDDEALGWIAEDTRRSDLSRLLSVHLGEGVQAGVVWERQLWTGRTGRSDWTPRGPTRPPVDVPSRKRVRWGLPVVIGGAVLSAVGGGLSLSALGSAQLDDNGRSTVDVETYDGLMSRYRLGNGLGIAGLAVAGIGIVGVL